MARARAKVVRAEAVASAGIFSVADILPRPMSRKGFRVLS